MLNIGGIWCWKNWVNQICLTILMCNNIKWVIMDSTTNSRS